ncbi:MAG: hypothetical protein HN704_09930 [Bacteroidetes bacterium]|jgi:hypothetical protein|nr:hypothetical protein [Bacteroidota bacterium]MBT6687114.1 hypothetical protein [Bacteroidota bacterium]MBT7145155.1 hypothetical protein [Bacteroidota bacterium]MBT7491912.1 hypothetical protein [Bacteroidota bacterium]
MKREILTLLALIMISNLVSSQNIIDQILTKSGDTICCKITLINDQNIFYSYQKRKTEKHDYISHNEVLSCIWASKDEITPENNDKKIIPYYSTTYWRLGINAVQQFNYPILHSVVALNLSKMNHLIYFGPNFNILLNNYFGDEVVIADSEKNSIGINFGYRYIVDSESKRMNFFMQLDFSIYEVKYKEWGGHGTGFKDTKNVIVENNGSIGLNYKISNSVELFGGIGLGSTEYFFLMLEHLIPHSFVGLHYKFK